MLVLVYSGDRKIAQTAQEIVQNQLGATPLTDIQEGEEYLVNKKGVLIVEDLKEWNHFKKFSVILLVIFNQNAGSDFYQEIVELPKFSYKIRYLNGCEDLNQQIKGLNFDHRPSWESYFMDLAVFASYRSSCKKRNVGAIIVKESRIISTGFNGTPVGTVNCIDGGCIRCNVESKIGENLDLCFCLHAEESAILGQAKEHTAGATMYVSLFPCGLCLKKIIQAGIKRVIFKEYYCAADHKLKKIFEDANIEIILNDSPEMLFAAIPYCYLFYLVAVCVFELYVVIMSRFLNSAVWGNIKDKWIVISGATDGIGKEIALQLAEKGQKLLVLGRNEEKLRNLKEEIDKITKKEDICQTAVFDFSHENDFSTLPDVPIGMLINNAGVSADHPEFFYDEPRMTDIITVNNINLLKLTKHCVPRMGENTYLINIGSGLADTVAPLMATYSASKAFVKHFSHSIHFELLQKKIFCQYVAPNMVSTKMSKCKPSFFSPSAKTFAEAFIKSIGAHYTISPYIPHVLQNILLKFIPSNVLGTLMFGAMSKTRTKALEKKAKND